MCASSLQKKALFLKRHNAEFLGLCFRRHKAEAAAAGITDVVDLDIPSEDQLEKDLLLLAKQQEKLIAELNRAMAEQDALNRDNWDEETRAAYEKEMLARVNELNQTYGTQGGEQAAQQANEVQPLLDARYNSPSVEIMFFLLKIYVVPLVRRHNSFLCACQSG